MKRGIWLIGVALTAIPLGFGVAEATAAKSKTTKPRPKPLAVTCTTKLGVMIANGDTKVTPPVQQGSEYGPASCTKTPGNGVQSDRFVVSDGGDTLATYTWYFRTGTIHGKYDLTPQEGSLNFLSVDYLGTLTVTGGSGTFQGAKGTGTMKCASPDSIHTVCTDKLKLTKP